MEKTSTKLNLNECYKAIVIISSRVIDNTHSKQLMNYVNNEFLQKNFLAQFLMAALSPTHIIALIIILIPDQVLLADTFNINWISGRNNQENFGFLWSFLFFEV